MHHSKGKLKALPAIITLGWRRLAKKFYSTGPSECASASQSTMTRTKTFRGVYFLELLLSVQLSSILSIILTKYDKCVQ